MKRIHTLRAAFIVTAAFWWTLSIPQSANSQGTGLTSLGTAPSVSCSGGLTAPIKNAIPLSLLERLNGDTMSRCDYLLYWGYGYQTEGKWKQSYDTLRLFLEQCPYYVGGKYNSGVVSTDAFGYINGSVSGWSAGGAGRWPDFLTWLKSVLYLNTDSTSGWYCADVMDMITAVQYDQAAKMSIIQYVTETGKCTGPTWETLYNTASHWRHQGWLDSLKSVFDKKYGDYFWKDSINADTLAHPYDSTIPTLEQEHLEILRGKQYAATEPSKPLAPNALLKVTLLDNPVEREIALEFEMGRTALVTMDLVDILGHSVPIANGKYHLEEPGSHTARIPVPNLPPGTYYLRITTDIGDAKTLRIVIE